MKFFVILFLAASLLTLLIPTAISAIRPLPEMDTVPSSPPPSPSAASAPAAPSPANMETTADSQITVQLLTDDGILTLAMDDYLFGVVAAEMPADFAEDALCAQAVAARTTTLHHMTGADHPAHPEADICSNASCCEAWLSEDALQARWGDAYEENARKVQSAVHSTDGVVVTYDSAPALCVYHSSSAGVTESSADVWGGALPYLVSVESPESPDSVPGYVTTVSVPQTEFRDVILDNFPDADLSGLPEEWIRDVTVTDGGRIGEMTVGGVHIAGTTIRNLFSLRSAAFTVEMTYENVVFTVTGYGHGVGMSQYGANILAGDGTPWQEILAWYYPGTELGSISDFAA
ncbi:MAG: stage II sporulation protein D [Oscillospiraceae bacterium]|nr:stage II sporulation protein D [Oscillospiraceae bacterium]